MFYLNFLIDAIKNTLQKKIQTCLGEKSRKRTVKFFVSFCVKFAGGNKNIIYKKQEK